MLARTDDEIKEDVVSAGYMMYDVKKLSDRFPAEL